MIDCPQCEGTGYVSKQVGNTSYAVRCDHGKGAGAPAGGFEPMGKLAESIVARVKTNGPEWIEQALARHSGDLSREEIRIARLVGRRLGQASAIRLQDLIAALGGGWTDRDIKGMVERLRTLARLPIAATKAPPFGYFIPATAAEADAMHDRYLREGIKLIRLAQQFRPDKDLVQELRGQLELKGAR
jgi:hypothetical protein